MTGSEQFRAALAIEWLKFTRARTVRVAGALLIAGTTAMSIVMLIAVDGGSPLLAGKADALVGSGGWTGLFAAAGTIVSAGGLLAFGVVCGWVFGREFTEGTVAGLFARPVSRQSIAAAKMLILILWPIPVAVCLATALACTGLILYAGAVPPEVPALAAKLATVTVLTGLLATPSAWAATLGKGYLAAITATICLVVLAQMVVLLGTGGWFPFAAPGLWAARPGAEINAETMIQLLLVLPIAAGSVALTLRAWRNLRLNG